jgi:hypothetical protein
LILKRSNRHDQAVNFAYELAGTGWADARIAVGDATAKVSVSYLTDDALGDLLDAVTATLGPAGEGGCIWLEDPGRYTWTFQRTGDEVEIRVDWFGPPEPELTFSATTTASDLGTAIVKAAEAVLAEHGEDGYQEKWLQAAFPARQLERLRGSLQGAD